jgi:hypothetical protein
MMGNKFRVYGLIVDSEILLPGLQKEICPDTVDLTVRCGFPLHREKWGTATALYIQRKRCPNGRRALIVELLPDIGYYHWKYCDGTEFLVENNGESIWVRWPETETEENAVSYLTGQILGFTLRLHKIVVLHASVVDLGGQAVGLMGPTGSGKSTLAAALIRRGCQPLSDDIAPLALHNGKFFVFPGLKLLKLWPDSTKALYGQSLELPRIVKQSGCWPDWDKRFVDLRPGKEKPTCTPRPLGALYILEQCLQTGWNIEPQYGHNRLVKLVCNSYLGFIPGSTQRAHELKVLGKLARQVPVKSFALHFDFSRLSEACDRIIADVSDVVKHQTLARY